MGNTVIQVRRDTASNWTSNNPTLAAGEMGFETDTNKLKFGDGSTAWNSLSYLTAGSTSFNYGLYFLSANQTSNFSVNNHVEFNTSQGSIGGLSTGSGQANGIISLTGGKTYKITGSFWTSTSSNGQTQLKLYDRTNSTYVGFRAAYLSANFNSSNSNGPVLFAIISPESNIDIDVRFYTVTNSDGIVSEGSWLLIEEYAGV